MSAIPKTYTAEELLAMPRDGIVNFKTRTITVYRGGGAGLSVLRRGDALSGEDVVPGFQCAVADIVE